MLEYVPLNPELVISIQNTLNLGYFSKHQNIFVFPHGAAEKRPIAKINHLNWAGFWHFLRHQKLEKNSTSPLWADYVIIDLKKPWFIIGQGCHWVQGTCIEGQHQFTSEFSSLVEKTEKKFYTIYKNDEFMILKNRSNQAETT